MKIDQQKFPSLFDKEIVARNYRYLIDPAMYVKIISMIEAANTVKTYLAKSIIDPMLSSYKKLIPLRRELSDACRALIYISKAGNPHVIHYVLLVEGNRINITGQIHCLINGSKDFGILFNVWIDRLDTEALTFRSYLDIPPILDIERHDSIMSVAISAILSAELFINFADVETKVMKPNTQIWDKRIVNALYNNKTGSDITVIDSTWYTNLVSSGAFKVRGHFRLQPCGTGRNQRKLTWINDFEKDGYTRRAKIDKS